MWSDILPFIGIGFIAQLIDGTLGMAYGVISNTFLLGLGIPAITPRIASACVHLPEIFLTGISGFFHYSFGNVDASLFRRLVIPGVLGGVLGAYILSSISGTVLKPYIYTYLLIMGLVILVKGLRKQIHHDNEIRKRHAMPLGLVGGFFDAIGGGGWGPIVTSTLVATGKNPRYVVGSVDLSEFFVTVAESITFILTIGTVFFSFWKIMLGLLIGGAIAAPIAARLCSIIPRRPLMIAVGIVIVIISTRTLISFLH